MLLQWSTQHVLTLTLGGVPQNSRRCTVGVWRSSGSPSISVCFLVGYDKSLDKRPGRSLLCALLKLSRSSFVAELVSPALSPRDGF